MCTRKIASIEIEFSCYEILLRDPRVEAVANLIEAFERYQTISRTSEILPRTGETEKETAASAWNLGARRFSSADPSVLCPLRATPVRLARRSLRLCVRVFVRYAVLSFALQMATHPAHIQTHRGEATRSVHVLWWNRPRVREATPIYRGLRG